MGEGEEEGDKLMALPPPSSLLAGLPAGSSDSGEGRERGRGGTGATGDFSGSIFRSHKCMLNFLVQIPRRPRAFFL